MGGVEENRASFLFGGSGRFWFWVWVWVVWGIGLALEVERRAARKASLRGEEEGLAVEWAWERREGVLEAFVGFRRVVEGGVARRASAVILGGSRREVADLGWGGGVVGVGGGGAWRRAGFVGAGFLWRSRRARRRSWKGWETSGMVELSFLGRGAALKARYAVLWLDEVAVAAREGLHLGDGMADGIGGGDWEVSLDAVLVLAGGDGLGEGFGGVQS